MLPQYGYSISVNTLYFITIVGFDGAVDSPHIRLKEKYLSPVKNTAVEDTLEAVLVLVYEHPLAHRLPARRFLAHIPEQGILIL